MNMFRNLFINKTTQRKKVSSLPCPSRGKGRGKGLLFLFLALAGSSYAQESPDGKLKVTVTCEDGKPSYVVTYNNTTCIGKSDLGLNTNIGDFTKDLTLKNTSEVKAVVADYT